MINKYTSNNSIAIFDSGLGGLTVLKVLKEKFKNESFIYFGDTAHVPYGNKSAETVIRYSKNILNFLITKNIKAVIIACNTASALAHHILSKEYNIPIFDVVQPSVLYSDKISKTRNIGVIGTSSTIAAKAYTKSFQLINSDCNIIEVACPLFVPLIEEGWNNSKIAKEISLHYLNIFNNTNIDVLILGCTHYPIMQNIIQQSISSNIKLILSGNTVGEMLEIYFKKHNYHKQSNQNIPTQFYVTDCSEKFVELGNKLLNEKIINIKQISNI